MQPFEGEQAPRSEQQHRVAEKKRSGVVGQGDLHRVFRICLYHKQLRRAVTEVQALHLSREAHLSPWRVGLCSEFWLVFSGGAHGNEVRCRRLFFLNIRALWEELCFLKYAQPQKAVDNVSVS